MIKTFVTLIRGRMAEVEQAAADAHALPILDQQIRDAVTALGRARRALAIATAQSETEVREAEAIDRRIADLESRARAALAAGQDRLATEAAEAIANLEADRDARRTAGRHFDSEAARLRRIIADADERLAALDRGRRLARASAAVRAMRPEPFDRAPLHRATLAEAEATLARLRQREAETAAAEAALERLEAGANRADIAERLADAGFGPPMRPRAADVLARLRQPAA